MTEKILEISHDQSHTHTYDTNDEDEERNQQYDGRKIKGKASSHNHSLDPRKWYARTPKPTNNFYENKNNEQSNVAPHYISIFHRACTFKIS